MGAREIYQFASPSRPLPRAAAEVNRSSALRGRFRPLWVAAGGFRFRSGSRPQPLVPGEKPLLASWGCGWAVLCCGRGRRGCYGLLGPGWSGAASGPHLPRWIREKLLDAEASPDPQSLGEWVGARGWRRDRAVRSIPPGLVSRCVPFLNYAPSDISEQSWVADTDWRPRASFLGLPLDLKSQNARVEESLKDQCLQAFRLINEEWGAERLGSWGNKFMWLCCFYD